MSCAEQRPDKAIDLLVLGIVLVVIQRHLRLLPGRGEGRGEGRENRKQARGSTRGRTKESKNTWMKIRKERNAAKSERTCEK